MAGRLKHLNRIRKVRRTFTPVWDEVERRLVVPEAPQTMFEAMAAQRRCLYSVPWLALRQRMNANGWKGIERVRQNLGLLSRYLNDNWDDQTRLWQVMDLFSRIRMYYLTTGLTSTDVDKLIIAARAKVRAAYSRTMLDDKGIYFNPPSVEDILRDWPQLNPVTQRDIVSDVKTSLLRGTNEHNRSEAQWFLMAIGEQEGEGAANVRESDDQRGQGDQSEARRLTTFRLKGSQ